MSFKVYVGKIAPVFISKASNVPVISGINKLTQTGVSIDIDNNVTGINNISIIGQAAIVLINEDVSITPVGPSGALAYDTVTNMVYVSDGVTWVTLGTTAGTILGPVSIVNRLTKVSGIDTIIETGVSVDAGDNITGVGDLTATGDYITGG